MRYLFALISLITCVLHTHAQNQDTVKIYLDENWKRLNSEIGAAYYRIVTPTNDGKFQVKDYYVSGQLQMEAICTAYDPKLTWEGVTKLYHKNGAVAEEGPFKDEERYGLHRYWYDNGARRADVFFREKKEIYHQYWSLSGEPFLSNGKGIVREQTKYNMEDFTYYMDFEDSLQTASFHIEGADTIYMMLKQIPEYEGGYHAMARAIGAAIKYPKSARRAGIEGTVYIQFIVDKKGEVKNCKIKRGIDAECDAEALRVVSSLKKWNPGMHKGKPVQVRFMLPVQFKLTS